MAAGPDPLVTRSSSRSFVEERKRISDEPLINVLHHHLPEIALAAYLLFIAYISLIPFDVDWSRLAAAGWPGRGLATRPISLADILANIGFYLPFGAGALFVVRRRGAGTGLAASAAIIASAMLSVLLEQAQIFVASRVASWVDVVANALGAGIGICLALSAHGRIRWFTAQARQSAHRNWWLAASKAAICLALLVQLRPYDVVTDPLRTAKNTIRQADAGGLFAWNQLADRLQGDVIAGRRSPEEWPRMRWDHALDRGTDVLIYAGVTALILMGLRAASASLWTSCLAAGFACLTLSALVTIIRIFLISHGLDAAQLLCGLVAWPMGCAAGFIAGRARQPDHSGGGGRADAAAAGLLITIMIISAYELAPFMWRPPGPLGGALASGPRLIPFLRHFEGRPNDALYNISGDLLRYFALGFVLARLLARRSIRSWRVQALLCSMACTALATIFESAHLFLVSRLADITTVILAGTGGGMGAVACRWLKDYHAFARVVVLDDLLTGQLISGAGYDKTRGALTPGSRRSDASRKDPVESPPPG